MHKVKLIRFLLLLVLIQALAMLYIAKQDIHAFLNSNFSKDGLMSTLARFSDDLATPANPDLSDIEKVPVKELRVDVPFANWRWVNETITADTPRTKIPAVLHVDDGDFDCTIRVSAGGVRHWMGERKSVRLRFDKNALYHGIYEINLNVPETKMVIIEGLAWEYAKTMGLPTPEFDYINLFINDQPEGLRLMYEDADGYFLRRNNLMGYIFTEERHSFPFHYETANDADYPHAKAINKKYGTLDEVRHLSKVLSYPSFEQFKKQIVTLADLPQIARWYAHSLICGSGHQNTHNIKLFFNSAQQKFQWLPWDVAGFGHWGDWPGSTRPIWSMDPDWSANHFLYKLNLIPEFVEERNRILWRYLNNELSLENQLAIVDKYYSKVRYHLHADKGRQASENKYEIRDFEKAIEELRQWIAKRHSFLINALREADVRVSYDELKIDPAGAATNGFAKVQGGVMLSLGTGLQSGVNLQKILIPTGGKKIDPDKIFVYIDANANGMLDPTDRHVDIRSREVFSEQGGRTISLSLAEHLMPARKAYRDRFFDYEDKGYVLQPRPFHRYYNYLVVYENDGTKSQASPIFANNFKVEAHNSVTGDRIEPEYFLNDPEKEFAFLYQEQSASSPTLALSEVSDVLDKATDLHAFLAASGDAKIKTIPAGEYVLKQNLRIEPDEKITVAAGARVAIQPAVSILVRGEFNAEGKAQQPVIFENAIPGQPWGSIAYYKTDKISTLRNAVVRHASMAKIDSVSFTGSISAYYASIVIDSCTFEEIQADDGLNMKYSNSSTLNSRFIATKDDAIDYDFGDGEIRNCYFYKPGGDAIDCGTANPVIAGNVVEFASDKGVSVGENSAPTIENNILFGGNYGIAVKDDSHPKIRNNTIIGNNIGLSLYIKKPDEFGCPAADVANVILWGNKREIENLCDAELNIQNSAVQGGFSGDDIYTEQPELLPNERGHRILLKSASFYFDKKIGAIQHAEYNK